MIIEDYFENVQQLLKQVAESQKEPIEKAARLFADAARRQKRIFAFGCSHAGLVTQELFYRSGGLAIINPIFAPGLTLDIRPITMTSQMERIPEYGRTIVQQNDIQEGDVLLLHSVSGRNPVPVDMALEAALRGASTICVTNLAYSRGSTSRHASGKKLFEVCDIVVDNCGCFGDASCRIEGFDQKVAPTSTAVGAVIVNAIAAGAVERMVESGETPPVFISANIEGGDEHNAQVMEKYRGCIRYLL